MKRIISLALVMILAVLALVSCGKEPVNLDLEAEAKAIMDTYGLENGKKYSSASTTLGEYLDEDLIRSYYGDLTSIPDFGTVEAYVVYIDETRPTLPCEFGLFKMKEGADANAFVAYLKARIDLKIENSKAYPTMDTSMLTTAKFVIKDNYVWYIAVKDGNDKINSALEEKFN